MKVCICGGGSLGHVCAGVLASHHDVEVCIFSGHPEKWHNSITVTDIHGKQYSAKLASVSSAPEEVVANQDIVLLCVPGFLIEKTLLDIRPFIGEAIVGTVVSSTGFFFFAHSILGESARLFGFQRVPFIARVSEYGRSANLLGYKSSLAIATENIENKEVLRHEIERLFLTPTSLLDNYLEVALTNSNPILHTSRLYTMFKGKENNVFDHMILFYKEWTNEASELLIKMDEEFFRLLDVLNVTSIPPLLDYYESTDAASLTRKISSIPAFQTIESPMVKVEGGWKADFRSRYFTEDFPFGLRWIGEIARRHNVVIPIIDEVLDWGCNQK